MKYIDYLDELEDDELLIEYQNITGDMSDEDDRGDLQDKLLFIRQNEIIDNEVQEGFNDEVAFGQK